MDDCEYALNEYLFIDSIHVTWPVHEAMAEQIAKTLREYKAPQVGMEHWKRGEEEKKTPRIER